MAQEDNYVSGVNSQRQRLRSARRQRGSDVIDSLESAAAMDRMRGVDVGSAGFSGVVDTPEMNVVGAVASSGGSKAPITTTGGVFQNMRRGSGYAVPRSTVQYSNPTGNCRNGQCGISRSTTVVGEPVFSYPSQATTITSQPTTVTSSPATTTTTSSASAPVTTVAAPPTVGDYLNLSRQATEMMMGTDPGADPTRVRTYATGGKQYNESAIVAMQDDINKHTQKMNEIAAANEAVQAAADARKTNAEAAAVEALLPKDVAKQRDDIVGRVVMEGISPTVAVDQIEALRGITYESQAKDGKKTIIASGRETTPREETLKELNGAYGVHLYVTSKQIFEQASKLTPADMVGRDPYTGKPINAVAGAPGKGKVEMTPAYQRSIEAIASGFRSQKLLGLDAEGKPLPFSSVQNAVTEYVAPTLQRYTKQQYVTANADEIAKAATPEEKVRLTKFYEEMGLQEAKNFLTLLDSELQFIHRKDGGLLPDQPKPSDGSWWNPFASPAAKPAAKQPPAPQPAAKTEGQPSPQPEGQPRKPVRYPNT